MWEIFSAVKKNLKTHMMQKQFRYCFRYTEKWVISQTARIPVAKGTLSAGRAYDQVKKKFYVRVLYICTNQIICKVEEGRKEELERRISRQLKAVDDTEF